MERNNDQLAGILVCKFIPLNNEVDKVRISLSVLHFTYDWTDSHFILFIFKSPGSSWKVKFSPLFLGPRVEMISLP